MALTTTTALSFYQLESADRTEWTNPITFSLEALSADDIEVCVINSSAAEAFQKLTLIKDTDYTLNFAAKTVTCTSTNWSDLSKINNHAANQIRVFRATSITELVDFTNGAVLSAEDLNLAYKQNLFAAQEMNEDAGHTKGGIQSVSSNALADNAVENAKIQNNAVTSDKIANDAVIAAKIANGAVTTTKLAAAAVTEEKIETEAVTTTKIENDAVTTVKIVDDAVTYDKVKSASKVQMEGQLGTGTHGTPGVVAGVVTPDVLKHSPFAPKCYGSVTYDTGDPSVAAGSFNVQSVANTSTTQRTITFNTALSNANYFVLVTGTSPSAITNFYATVIQKSTSGFVIDAAETAEAANLNFDFVVFGSTY